MTATRLSLLLLLASSPVLAVQPPAPPTDTPTAATAAAPELTPQQRATAQYHVMAGEMAAGREQPALAAREFLAALRLVPDLELAQRATALAVAGRDETLALAAARRWQELEPQSMEAREVVARIALRQGRLGEVLDQTRAIIKGHAGGPAEGFDQVAVILGQTGADRADGALATLQQLVSEWPDLAGAHHALGVLALRQERLPLAEQAALKAQALAPKTREHRLLHVGVLAKQDRIAEADAIVDGLAKDDPRALELRMGYAKLLLESGRREAARAQLGTILKANPKYVDARFALGVLAFNDRDYAGAETQLSGLLEGPRAADAAFELARIAEARKDYPKALEYYGRITRGTQAIEASIRSAAVLVQSGKAAEGRQRLRDLREQYPPFAERLHLAEGEILVEAGQLDEALALYTDALAGDPDNNDLIYGRSLVYERLKRIDLAEKDLRRMLSAEPEDARALNALGYMLAVHTRRFDEAHDLVKRALAIEPDDAAIIDSMGWIQFKRGKVEDARDWLIKAFSRFPDPEVAAHLGEVLWSLGQKDEARAIWQNALQASPEHPVLNETIRRLNR